MKELDVLLESFLEHNLETLRSGGFPQLELFLETEDDLMWAWFQHSDRPEREEFAELIEKICGDL